MNFYYLNWALKSPSPLRNTRRPRRQFQRRVCRHYSINTIRRLDMSKEKPREPIPHMNYLQYRRMRKLVHECCNYDDGNCIALDDGEECALSRAFHILCCANGFAPPCFCWIRNWKRNCIRRRIPASAPCGQPFHTAHKNALYCKACATERIRRSKRDWARKNRGRQ